MRVLVRQHPVMADHLGQLYERRDLPNKAAEMYALALAGNDRMTETRFRLAKLLGSESKMEQQISSARDRISRMREWHRMSKRLTARTEEKTTSCWEKKSLLWRRGFPHSLSRQIL